MPVTKWLPLWLPVPTKVALTVSFITQPTTAGSYCAHFFFNNFSVVSVCDFANKKKKATNAGVCCYSCCACFDISLLFSLYIDQCCYRCFWTSLGYLFLISLRPQTLLIDYWLLSVGCRSIGSTSPSLRSHRFDSSHAHACLVQLFSLSLSATHTLSLTKSKNYHSESNRSFFLSFFFLFLARIAGELSISPHTHPPESNKGLSFFFLFL